MARSANVPTTWSAVQALAAFARRPSGPLILALLLSLLSWPIVAVNLVVWTSVNREVPTLPWDLAIAMALGGVIAGGAVGGSIGAHFVRRKPRLALLLALVTAWPAGIAALPILPWVLGRPFVLVMFCVDACTGSIVALEPGQSPIAASAIALGYYAMSIVFMAVAFAWPLVLGALLSWRLEREQEVWKRRTPIVAVLAWGAVNLFSVAFAAGAAASLVLGLAVWHFACARAFGPATSGTT